MFTELASPRNDDWIGRFPLQQPFRVFFLFRHLALHHHNFAHKLWSIGGDHRHAWSYGFTPHPSCCKQKLSKQLKPSSSWSSTAVTSIRPKSLGDLDLKLYTPEMNECPWTRGLFQQGNIRNLHLPTIDFQGTCYFSGGWVPFGNCDCWWWRLRIFNRVDLSQRAV